MEKVAAIYARLSREDEDKIDKSMESRSIENQVKYLSEYAQNNNYVVNNIYIDDGISGSCPNRPGLLKMLQDAENKKFNVLLIKDLSRLGRSMHLVGNLIENVFPQCQIRVIALSDNYDSVLHKNDDSVVIRNFLNQYYIKDFKRKIRKSIVHRASTKHMSSVPQYGYMLDEDHKEVVDPYAACIIQRIYHEYLLGYSTTKIANGLNNDNILPKGKYLVEVLKHKCKWKSLCRKWNTATVLEILKNYEYCGHSINNIFCENRKIIIKNNHPSIIDEETFQKVKEIIEEKKKKRKSIYNPIVI